MPQSSVPITLPLLNFGLQARIKNKGAPAKKSSNRHRCLNRSPPLTGEWNRHPRRGGGARGEQWEIWESQNKKWIDEYEAGKRDHDEEPMAETAEPPPDIILPLLQFQKEWLAWALKQESSSEMRGGILADEMGMGKTIQARRPPAPSPADIPSSSSPPLPGRTRATLIICPVAAPIQWPGEIELYPSEGSTRVLVYHGTKRAKVEQEFDKYDFVITTYSTIESDHRTHIMPPKEECGMMVSPKKVWYHRKSYQQSKQVKKKGKVNPKDGQSLLHSVRWERIILDEVISLL